MFRKILSILPALGLLGATLFGPVTTPVMAQSTPVTITVFAASSLTDGFNEIGKLFELYNPGVKVVFSYAGSQVLSQQLAQGAPADVFASANQAQMDVAVKAGRVGTSTVFVLNRLVAIAPASNTANVKTLQDLGKPGLRVVLAAKAVPVGQYALDYLAKASADPTFGAGYQTAVLSNVVSYEDNVKQVLAKVALGEADAGIVYTTDVLGASSSKVVKIKIPDNLNTIAKYPIGYVSNTANAYWAKAFVKFVLSRDGQRTLGKYGFIGAAPLHPVVK